MVLVPVYNVGAMPATAFELLFKQLSGVELQTSCEFNFLWLPFNLRAYRTDHGPFRAAFEEKHGVGFDAVLAIIAALCLRVFFRWRYHAPTSIIRDWQRAYEGPLLREVLQHEIQLLATQASMVIDPNEHQVSDANLDRAFRFLELGDSNRSDIDLLYPGPHHLILPYDGERVFVDYAWILRRLIDLFIGTHIADQRFKGDLLEMVVRFTESVLPVGPCKSSDGMSKQIDAAFSMDKRLVIVECKAVGQSIGFERGDPEAMAFRKRLVDESLSQVDDKAMWLANHPEGANYDIRHYEDILPIAVTPFVEYVPTTDPHYWLTEHLPRILTPHELKMALENGTLASVAANCIKISSSQ